MHPNPLFRTDDHAQMRATVERIGFGMIFLTTPQGPRVAHTPLLWTGEDRLRFHLARGNALVRHLDGATALATVNGAHGYVSPRWYENRDTVPTWDYVAIELEGLVRRLDDAELDGLLYDLIDTHEDRLEGERWNASEASEDMWNGLFKAIVGFELEVREWRPTYKLSQKRSASEREAIAAGLAVGGNEELAATIRGLAG
ncbi:FMN-binding negative transcriptional regulator [Qipengyuania sp. YG27]|uniref:FMN-binding negative transcriptional regulator n=1 Tax=Qipengyuania mesophila TaxID=2867246 RepID=A0ABS7JWV4_9SPHN|nr:FMN-binding negative transcriptional regulator [Qipengyuania mesophila]MBX7502089.1 FMN-binding negative transcriptional regulator [Qipengyuania mesophila]